MKSPEEALKRWLQPGVFFIWSWFLIYLLISQRCVIRISRKQLLSIMKLTRYNKIIDSIPILR